jgi:hypothetical protein
MSRPDSLGQTRPFIVTSKGRDAAAGAPRCTCHWHVDEGLLVCCECGTGMALARSDSKVGGSKRD